MIGNFSVAHISLSFLILISMSRKVSRGHEAHEEQYICKRWLWLELVRYVHTCGGKHGS